MSKVEQPRVYKCSEYVTEYRIGGKYGDLHRDGGPAYINTKYHVKVWFQYGKRHRENGPAEIRYSGTKAWYRRGNLHCEDGPAVIYKDGRKQYYINNQRVQKGSLALKLIQEKERRKEKNNDKIKKTSYSKKIS